MSYLISVGTTPGDIAVTFLVTSSTCPEEDIEGIKNLTILYTSQQH